MTQSPSAWETLQARSVIGEHIDSSLYINSVKPGVICAEDP